MKLKILMTALPVLVAVPAAAQKSPEGMIELKTQLDSVSYSVGHNMGKQLRPDSVHLNLDAFVRGYLDGHDSLKTMLDPAQMVEVMMRFQEHMTKMIEAKAKIAGEANRNAGTAFCATNRKQPGVVELPSGLQYQILRPGTGRKPKGRDEVEVLYRGTLIDGTVFDSTADRDNPVLFSLDRVIPGWTEALQLMQEGSIWRIVIPPGLAYGENPPPGGKIGPDATLVFEVELLKVLRSQ